MTTLQITAASVEPALFDLPWHIPLEDWPEENIAALPRGISRHIVRFAHLSGRIIAIKEIGEFIAHREYELLRNLGKIDAPAVVPLAVVTGRVDENGKPLQAVLITEHLSYSLPYRALFGTFLKPETADRLIDALSILLVRLHLIGFYWGDVSLSNTLFRRDAGEFAAYLVDAETGELHDNLSDGKRVYDIDVARTNIIGELMDLQAGGMLTEDVDVIALGNRLEERYTTLWGELTREESFATTERWRVADRIDRLNRLGFDVGELAMTTESGGQAVTIQPKVVDAGHYHRQIMRMTGLEVEENQARRLLNDIKSFRTLTNRSDVSLDVVAREWMTEIFEPAVNAVPVHLRGRLQPAEMYHELLEHRWYTSEKAGHDVSMNYAIRSYIENILVYRPDEKLLLGAIINDE